MNGVKERKAKKNRKGARKKVRGRVANRGKKGRGRGDRRKGKEEAAGGRKKMEVGEGGNGGERE